MTSVKVGKIGTTFPASTLSFGDFVDFPMAGKKTVRPLLECNKFPIVESAFPQ